MVGACRGCKDFSDFFRVLLPVLSRILSNTHLSKNVHFLITKVGEEGRKGRYGITALLHQAYFSNRLPARLSFPATEPPDPRRVRERFQNGVSEEVSEGFSKGLSRVLEGF